MKAGTRSGKIAALALSAIIAGCNAQNHQKQEENHGNQEKYYLSENEDYQEAEAKNTRLFEEFLKLHKRNDFLKNQNLKESTFKKNMEKELSELREENLRIETDLHGEKERKKRFLNSHTELSSFNKLARAYGKALQKNADLRKKSYSGVFSQLAGFEVNLDSILRDISANLKMRSRILVKNYNCHPVHSAAAFEKIIDGLEFLKSEVYETGMYKNPSSTGQKQFRKAVDRHISSDNEMGILERALGSVIARFGEDYEKLKVNLAKNQEGDLRETTRMRITEYLVNLSRSSPKVSVYAKKSDKNTLLAVLDFAGPKSHLKVSIDDKVKCSIERNYDNVNLSEFRELKNHYSYSLDVKVLQKELKRYQRLMKESNENLVKYHLEVFAYTIGRNVQLVLAASYIDNGKLKARGFRGAFFHPKKYGKFGWVAGNFADVYAEGILTQDQAREIPSRVVLPGSIFRLTAYHTDNLVNSQLRYRPKARRMSKIIEERWVPIDRSGVEKAIQKRLLRYLHAGKSISGTAENLMGPVPGMSSLEARNKAQFYVQCRWLR